MDQWPIIHFERDFLGIVILLGFGIMAYAKTTYPIRWNWVFKNAVGSSSQFERDDRFWLNNFNLLMWIIFLIGSGCFIYLWQSKLSNQLVRIPVETLYSNWTYIGLFYLLKFAFIYFIAEVFRIPKTVSRNVQVRFTSIHLSGFIFLISSLLALYIPWGGIYILYGGGSAGLLLLIFGMLRQVYRMSKARFRVVWIYIILYICTLEIAPILFFIERGLKV